MPGMSGVDLARIVRARSPRTLVHAGVRLFRSSAIPPDLICLHKRSAKADLAEHNRRLRTNAGRP
jgi:hypothetical protein